MDLEQQLRAALVRTTPGPHVRAAVVARLGATPGRRGPNRWLMGSAVLALAAAAAMLVMQLPERQTAAVVVESPLAPESLSTDESGPAEQPGIQASVADPASAPEVEAQQVGPSARRFTVQVQPLQSDAVDAPRKEAIEAVYAAFLDGLRSVPGLTLVGSAGGSGTAQPADFRLIVIGRVNPGASPAGRDYHVNIEAQRSGPGGGAASSFMTGMSGESAPRCASGSVDLLATDVSCGDAVGVASGLLATLRKMVFPPDPQMQSNLQERLMDQAENSAVRLRALTDLASLGRASGIIGWNEFPPGLRDPAVIRAAIQFASTTQDPAARAQVWYTLRGSGDPGLVLPLMSALRVDGDDDTRVQALETLAADFAAEPRVRVALEAAAAGDPAPMVRALAQRALGDDASWMGYVQASLKDKERSPVERVEALFHAYGLPSPRGYGSFSADGRILRKLDDASMQALTETLPRAAADSERYARASHTLVSQLGQMDHPAIAAMLVDALGDGASWLDPSFAIQALRRHTGNPEVRATLERIAAEHRDTKLREVAAGTLRGDVPQQPGTAASREVTSTTPPPPRLGVMTEYVKAGPDVPANLVDKLSIAHMGFGTVAERAGIKEGDILLEIDGKPITSGTQLIEVLDALPRDVGVDVVVSRDGQIMRHTARF